MDKHEENKTTPRVIVASLCQAIVQGIIANPLYDDIVLFMDKDCICIDDHKHHDRKVYFDVEFLNYLCMVVEHATEHYRPRDIAEARHDEMVIMTNAFDQILAKLDKPVVGVVKTSGFYLPATEFMSKTQILMQMAKEAEAQGQKVIWVGVKE